MHGIKAEIDNIQPIKTYENTENIYQNMVATGHYVQKELQRLADYNKKIFDTNQDLLHDHHDKINDALFMQHKEQNKALTTHQKDIGDALTQHQKDIGRTIVDHHTAMTNRLIIRFERVEGTLIIEFTSEAWNLRTLTKGYISCHL